MFDFALMIYVLNHLMAVFASIMFVYILELIFHQYLLFVLFLSAFLFIEFHLLYIIFAIILLSFKFSKSMIFIIVFQLFFSILIPHSAYNRFCHFVNIYFHYLYYSLLFHQKSIFYKFY